MKFGYRDSVRTSMDGTSSTEGCVRFHERLTDVNALDVL